MNERRRAAIKRYTQARLALNENYLADVAAGIDYETPEFLELNGECWEAEQALPRWRSWLIDMRVLRQTQFWHRMEQAERQGGFR